MKSFRSTVKKRMLLCSVLVLISVALIVSHQFGLFGIKELSLKNPELADFQAGLFMGFTLLSLVLLFRHGSALKDETRLMFTSGLMILAGNIAGYFDKTVFYTLIAAALVQMTLGVAAKIYYLKHM